VDETGLVIHFTCDNIHISTPFSHIIISSLFPKSQKDPPKDYSILSTSKRKRCFSCRELIDIGSDVGEFGSWRHPYNDIEERIHGDEVRMADFYMCEECIGLFWSMTDLGFCISLEKGETMSELAKLSGQVALDG